MPKGWDNLKGYMQKGIALIAVIILILVLALLAGYLIFSKSAIIPGSSKTKPLFFGEYSLILPEGFKANEVIISEIEPAFDTCTINPQQLSSKNVPCKYVVIESTGDETKIVISDTPKWGLGGGGYIATFNEKIELGPVGYKSEFSSIWIAGNIDENGVATEKLFLENGHPVLYYTTGCIRPTLCIHMNAEQSNEDSSGYPDNSWQLEKFKRFVNFLEIKQLDISTSSQNYTNEEWKFALEIPKGYSVEGSDGLFYVVKDSDVELEAPQNEIRIRIEKDSKTTVSPDESTEIISEETVSINGIQGQKTVVSFKDYPKGNRCPIYRLQSSGIVYEFSLYECLESDIFEAVVKSFKSIP